ncbi:hypothetical protein Acr_17g0004050 [Actinidia rufa]|uniref:Uncharacterized protein n=1 Tax=Actinidia rufa TaxID=165716 RepID=A0A7J0G234_9ERIC|nr:hypothetical protein Acr_17g0004050 [Actinidia rufa]
MYGDGDDFFKRLGVIGFPVVCQGELLHFTSEYLCVITQFFCDCYWVGGTEEVSTLHGRDKALPGHFLIRPLSRQSLLGRGAIYHNKILPYGVWCGSPPKVIGKLIHPKGCVAFSQIRSGGWSVIAVPSFWGIGWWASSYILPQVTPLNEVGNLFLQLKTVLSIMSMVPVEFTIFVPVPLLGSTWATGALSGGRVNSGQRGGVRGCLSLDRLDLGQVSCTSSPPYNQLVSYQVLSSYDHPFLVAFVWPRPNSSAAIYLSALLWSADKVSGMFLERESNSGPDGKHSSVGFLQLIKLATKSRLSSPKESMVPGDSFRNHDLAGPFRVAENALHMNFIRANPRETLGFYASPEIRALNTLSVNGGSVCLTRASTVIGAFVPVLMASSRASKSRIFCEVDLSRAPDGWCCWRLELAAARSCIRRALFSFHDPHLVGHAMYFVMETFQIWNLASVGHGRSSIIQGAASTWSGRTKANGRGEAAQNPSGVEIRPRRSKPEIRVEIFRKRFLGNSAKEVYPRFWRVLVEIPSILPRPMARRRQYPSSWRADDQSDGGSGELSGDDLARSHGLVLPRSRGFGDKHRLGSSWATSSEMARYTP